VNAGAEGDALGQVLRGPLVPVGDPQRMSHSSAARLSSTRESSEHGSRTPGCYWPRDTGRLLKVGRLSSGLSRWLSFQDGARFAGWGPGRLRRLDCEIGLAEVVWPGPRLVGTYATLRAWCVRTGHGLGQKEHEADRWVAVTAVWRCELK
jgi:hypothetical protein